MGHPPVFPKSQFVRARLGKKWKLLCYVIQQCMSRRSAGFDNFPCDIASPIVAIAENKPFNMSKWIMNGFVFNLVKGKRFKFLMYPRLLQLMINVAYPIIREEGFAGGILYTEDMNDLSYKKMSIGNVPSVDLFEYMRNIANNEEEIGVVYYHISNGEIVNPLDLVDQEIDEDENDSDDSGDDDSNDSAESVVDDTDAGITVSVPVDLPTTSSQAAENIDEPKESSPKVASDVDLNEEENKVFHLERMVAKLLDANEQMKASNERKKKRLEEFWATHQKNLETFKALDADHEKLKVEHEQLKADYEELQAECNTLRAEKEVLENWIKEEETVSSESDKDFMVEEDVGVSETPRDVAVYQTRSQRSKTVTEPIVESVPIPDEAADTVNLDKAEGKRKLDAVPEILAEEVSTKKARIEETVQIEPIQSESVTETEVLEVTESVKETGTDETVQIESIQSEETVQFEPVQTETAPMIEALDDLDDIDFTDSEPEAANPDDEIPVDLLERFAYLERMKYNPVYLNGLTVSQINEEYEKCLTTQDKATADEKEFVVEMGEWTPLQESLNIDDLPPEELYHQNPEEMTSRNMREWVSSRNYPYNTLKRLKHESLKRIVISFMKTEKMYNRMFYLDYNNPQYYKLTKRYKVLGPKELPVMALPEDAHKKRQELIDMFPSEVKSYNIPMDVRESWHKSATSGDIVRSLLSKGQSVAELLDSLIVPEKSKKVKIIAWKYDEVFDAFLIKRVNGLCDVYHYYSSIFKLEVQDLKELHKLRLINHTHAERGDKCVMLLDASISRLPKYLEFRGQQEDSAYVQSKKKRKQKKLVMRDMYLEEFSDEYFDKVTNPGLKVIDGTQVTKPILKFFYNQETFELKLVRNLDDWDKDMITLFTASEKIRIRKALLNANLVKVDIPEIEFMRVTAKGTLEVQVKGRELPYEFYANIDFAGLTLDSLRRMNDCAILTNESKPRRAKIAEKFKSCIEEALKEQEEYKGKELLDVKDDPEYWLKIDAEKPS
ncbi:hypothetical protein QVD17_30808 [Tagetes erecta]|uniref:Uncharacterized protein n=1 Tax=Tagetes erecta TaxID=13708 RepID=A0AAD8NML0_TARER|nr:hypothetical protein QVD17_30808 [Tagetes erecta]